MSSPLVVMGDKTTHGGTVITADRRRGSGSSGQRRANRRTDVVGHLPCMPIEGGGRRQFNGYSGLSMIDVMERLTLLRQEIASLRLYALVDGAQYETKRDERITHRPGFYSLFEGTPDAPLAHAGPWLVDTESVDEAFVTDLAQLELETGIVSWLIAPQSLEGLGQLLQLNLDTKMPDGRTALLRFWDPRVLASLAEILSTEQRETFFGHVHEWHLLYKGKRAWIGRPNADA